MNGWSCGQCGSDDKSVQRFYHFRPVRKEEKLCWDCRYPIIKKRLESKIVDGEQVPKHEPNLPSLDDW